MATYIAAELNIMHKNNPKTQKEEWYYRIKESYRDLTGRPRNRVILNVGFITEAHSP